MTISNAERDWICQDPAGEWGVARVHTNQVMPRPCGECPWRRDAELGRFPDTVFDSSRHTSVQPEAWTGQPQGKFGCHSAPQGNSATCAGFLAVAGTENIDVRIAVVEGVIDPAALESGLDWPDLYTSYDEMAAANRAANAQKASPDAGEPRAPTTTDRP